MARKCFKGDVRARRRKREGEERRGKRAQQHAFPNRLNKKKTRGEKLGAELRIEGVDSTDELAKNN